MKVFVVTWGSAQAQFEYDQPVAAYCGSAGVFVDRKSAEKAAAMEAQKTLDQLYESYEETDQEDDEDRDWVKNRTNHEVYGDVKSDYLEIDWGVDEESDTDRIQYYFRIEEKVLNVAE